VTLARETVNDIRSGAVAKEKLVISKTVKSENQYKDPNKMANVIAARKLKEQGYEVVPGMKVSYIVTNGHKVPQEVEPSLEDKVFPKEPDWEYYTERMALMISRITEGIIPEHELDYKGLVSGQQQKSLFSDGFSKPDEAQETEEEEVEEFEADEEESELANDTGKKANKKRGKSQTRKKRKRPEKGEGATNLEDFL
jgi:DNA polymerase I